jgi:peptidoglycan/LPS O-acetylase OafA/YrhL
VHPGEPQRTTVRTSFADAFDARRNAFNFLRLVLAVLVIVGHCFPLGGFGKESPVLALTGGRYSLGTLAVGMFFVISGFLITRSVSSGLSVGRFIWHRFVRLFPGYWMCLLVTAFIFAPIFCKIEHGTFTEIFVAPAHTPQAYVIDHAAMFVPRGFSMDSVMGVSWGHVVGVLSHNPTPWAINGSLWSLPIELLCYLVMAVLAVLGMVQQRRAVVVTLFAILLAAREVKCISPDTFQQYYPFHGFNDLSYFCFHFFAGSVCFLFREKIPYSKTLFVTSAGLAALGMMVSPLGFLCPIALPYCFLCLSFTMPVPRFSIKGDYSYGTYISAFPVQQGLTLLGLHHAGFALYLGCSLLVTGALAILSYRLVEAPCLRWKNCDAVSAIAGWFSPAPRPVLATVPTSKP